MTAKKKKRLVEIVWLDADCEGGWQSDDEKKDQETVEYMHVYGVLVNGGRRGDKFVTISFGYNEDAEEWLGKSRIPMGMVKSIKTIRYLEA